MNTTLTMDEVSKESLELPGGQLARLREKKGYSQEYVAGKLHLRVRIIELLEADDYEQLPEPVFIKGYLRGYALLLGISPEPFLTTYNALYGSERKLEKALWQGKKKPNIREKMLKWITISLAIVAVVAASLWWQKNKYNQADVAALEQANPGAEQQEKVTQLTDLSRMQSMFSDTANEPTTEVQGG